MEGWGGGGIAQGVADPKNYIILCEQLPLFHIVLLWRAFRTSESFQNFKKHFGTLYVINAAVEKEKKCVMELH
jgi:hypothetical protein